MSYFGGQFEHHQMYSTLGRSEMALTWAIPVDIIQLLSHVDAFESAQPDVRTLRLCNRFGKGKNAYVAKLPKEIIDMIEKQLLVQHLVTQSAQKAVDWSSRYCCFESSCRPADHAEGYERKLLDQAIATVRNQHPHLGDTSSLSELKKFAGWKTAMTDQREGELPSYRTLIRKHFGLELFVMHENMDIETGQYLQRTDCRIPEGRMPNQVTICYLKLPSTHAVMHTMIDYGCGNSGYAAGFGPAPSQIKSLEISSQGRSHNAQWDKTPAEVDEEDEEVQAYFKDLETSGWPKLVLLVKERFDIDGVPDSES
ncbi:hypothetical protein KCU73_g582, partial [Aureobasidium melanogenum]